MDMQITSVNYIFYCLNTYLYFPGEAFIIYRICTIFYIVKTCFNGTLVKMEHGIESVKHLN